MSTNPDAAYGFAKQHSMPALRPPPAYRPPPGPSAQQSGRNSSPAEPPPYREPPPAETSVRYRGPSPQNGPVRPPHYSPPPTHRTPHLSRHPSRGSLIGAPRGAQASSNYPQHQQHGLPFRQQQSTQPYPTYQVLEHFINIKIDFYFYLNFSFEIKKSTAFVKQFSRKNHISELCET
jgi:hypothetical protein